MSFGGFLILRKLQRSGSQDHRKTKTSLCSHSQNWKGDILTLYTSRHRKGVLISQRGVVLMKRTIFLTFVLVVALSASVALGDDHNVQRVPAGAVAFYFVANLESGVLVGYIAFIEGVQEPFFNGTPGWVPPFSRSDLTREPTPVSFPCP